MGKEVLAYWPNIIGYIRIALILFSWLAFRTPPVFVPLYSTFIVLDGLDGWVARKLGQTSEFGAWLDVVIDNLGRGMLWSLLFEWGWLVSAVEWCVFVCNHNTRGGQWKSSFTHSPRWIQVLMANGFRTPQGALLIGGLHGLPLGLYVWQWGIYTHPFVPTLAIIILSVGRLLALSAEIWCIWTHVEYLTKDKEEGTKK